MARGRSHNGHDSDEIILPNLKPGLCQGYRVTAMFTRTTPLSKDGSDLCPALGSLMRENNG